MVSGGGGDDLVRGGANDDVVHGDDGVDVLLGDGGTDFLFGDQVDGGSSDPNVNFKPHGLGQRLFGGEGIDGVHCLASDGTLIGQIHLPETCANVCFGGLKRNRLFIRVD